MIKTRLTEEDVVEVLARQDAINAHARTLTCESCGSDQLQIVRYYPPAQWKCRLCKYRFTSEPSHARQDARGQS